MKNIFVILILLISSEVVSQQNLYVDCYSENTLFRNEVKNYKNMIFNCGYYFLMEDSSQMTIKGVVGFGEIVRSDAGGGVYFPELGFDRIVGDVNPKLILIGCPSLYVNLIIGKDIDVEYRGCRNIRVNN